MSIAIPSSRHNTYQAFVKSCRMIFMGWILSSLGFIVVFSGILLFKTGLGVSLGFGLILLVIGVLSIITGTSRKRFYCEKLIHEDDSMERLEIFSMLWSGLNKKPFVCLVDDGLSPRFALILSSVRCYLLCFVLEENLPQSATEIIKSFESAFAGIWQNPIIIESVVTRQELQIQSQRILDEWDDKTPQFQSLELILEYAKKQHFMVLFGEELIYFSLQAFNQTTGNNASKKQTQALSTHSNQAESDHPREKQAKIPKPKSIPEPKPNHPKVPVVTSIESKQNFKMKPGGQFVKFKALFSLLIVLSLLAILFINLERVKTTLQEVVPLEWHEQCGFAKIIEMPEKNINATASSSLPLYADLGGSWIVTHLQAGSTVKVLQRELFGNDIWYFINSNSSEAGWTKADHLKFEHEIPKNTVIYLEPRLNASNNISPSYSLPYVPLKKYIATNKTWIYIRTITQDEGWIQGEGLR